MAEQAPTVHEKPASSERKVSDETLKRFGDFVKTRATQPAPYAAGKRLAGSFDVSDVATPIPVSSILYEHYDYDSCEGGVGPSGQKEDLQLSIGAGPDKVEIFAMFVKIEDGDITGINYDVAGFYKQGVEADDAMVNGVLDSIANGEAGGKITPAAGPE